jgi:tRNA(fMet)-specific endonuclease VapC
VTRLLLDTSVLVAAEQRGGARGGAGSGAGGGLAATLPDDADVAVAALTIAELAVGVELASAQHRRRRVAFVDDVRCTLPALPYDLRVAEVHARLLTAVRRAGRPRGAHVLIIAATAAAWDRTVVTHDAGAFAELPGVTVREVATGG